MIKKTFPIIIALASFLISESKAQSDGATEQEKAVLTALLNDFLKGASKGDAEMHDRFWAEDLIYTSSAGKRRGKAQQMADLQKQVDPAPPQASYSAEDIIIQLYDDMAIVAFKLIGKVEINSKTEVSRYLNSGTFVKRDGQWKAVNWQATKLND